MIRVCLNFMYQLLIQGYLYQIYIYYIFVIQTTKLMSVLIVQLQIDV